MPAQRARLAASSFALALLFLPRAAAAEIPTGTFEFALFLNQSVWVDVTEGEAEEQFCEGFAEGFGGTLQTCEFSMFLDPKGKISGAATVAAVDGGLSVHLEGPVKGKLKGDGETGLSDLSFSLKLSGEVSDGLMPASVSATVDFAGQIDGDGALRGDWSTKFCSKAAGCLSEMETPAPEALAGGGWTLVITIADLGSGKLGGDAFAELADGTQCPYSIGGKYSAKNDTASLKLTPASEACSGTSISLKDVQRTTALTAQMKYKLFGKKGEPFVSSISR